MNWKLITRGLCKKLDMGHSELSQLTNIPRRTLSRYYEGYRTPVDKYETSLIRFIKNKKFDIRNLEHIGKTVKFEEKYSINLKKSTDLAEFIGIILGDGEIHADGTIRISFDPKKDKNYLKYRLFPLIENLFNKNPTYESYKRINFHSRDVVLYFRDNFNLKPGNKVKNGLEIPTWCFEKHKYLSAVLRGIFDTDGYIAYTCGRIEIQFGRFAEKAKPLVDSISEALSRWGIKHKKVKRDKRRFIRIQDRINVLKFFKVCGSANCRNITRFLLWRLQRREARIEKEGLDKLLNQLKKSKISINSVKIPFLWNLNNKQFIEKVKEDDLLIKSAEIRSNYNWPLLMQNILKKVNQKELAQSLKIDSRSVRKWREGRRIPSYKFVPFLLKSAEENNINISKYKVQW